MSLSKIFPIPFSESNQNIFIIGEVNCCKTSLMFQAATSLINDNSETVVLICPSQLTKIPLHVHKMPQLNESSAKVISILYLSNLKDLNDYIGKLFITTQKLRAILIDNLDQFVNSSELSNEAICKNSLTHLLALAIDTAGHFFNTTGEPCQVFVTCDANVEDSIFLVFRTIASYFFDDIWTVKKSNQLGISKSYTLVNQASYISYFYVEEGQIFFNHLSKKL